MPIPAVARFCPTVNVWFGPPSGRPVVGTEVGGLKEVVPDGVAGVIVDPRDDEAIAAALGRMLSAPPDPTTCREAALVHSLDVETDRVLEVLAAAARR